MTGISFFVLECLFVTMLSPWDIDSKTGAESSLSCSDKDGDIIARSGRILILN